MSTPVPRLARILRQAQDEKCAGAWLGFPHVLVNCVGDAREVDVAAGVDPAAVAGAPAVEAGQHPARRVEDADAGGAAVDLSLADQEVALRVAEMSIGRWMSFQNSMNSPLRVKSWMRWFSRSQTMIRSPSMIRLWGRWKWLASDLPGWPQDWISSPSEVKRCTRELR